MARKVRRPTGPSEGGPRLPAAGAPCPTAVGQGHIRPSVVLPAERRGSGRASWFRSSVVRRRLSGRASWFRSSVVRRPFRSSVVLPVAKSTDATRSTSPDGFAGRSRQVLAGLSQESPGVVRPPGRQVSRRPHSAKVGRRPWVTSGRASCFRSSVVRRRRVSGRASCRSSVVSGRASCFRSRRRGADRARRSTVRWPLRRVSAASSPACAGRLSPGSWPLSPGFGRSRRVFGRSQPGAPRRVRPPGR